MYYSTYAEKLYEPYRLLEEAHKKFNEGYQHEALDIIYNAIEKYPDQGFLYCFGSLLIDASDVYVEKAKIVLERGRELFPDDLTIKVHLGICLTILRWTEEAIALFMEVLEEDSQNLEALHYMATAYLLAGDYDIAKDVIYRKLELAYEPSGLANLFAILLAEYQDTKDLTNCLIILRQLLEMEPSYRKYALKESIGYGKEAHERIKEVVFEVTGFHVDEDPRPHPLFGTFHE